MSIARCLCMYSGGSSFAGTSGMALAAQTPNGGGGGSAASFPTSGLPACVKATSQVSVSGPTPATQIQRHKIPESTPNTCKGSYTVTLDVSLAPDPGCREIRPGKSTTFEVTLSL